MIEKLKEKGFDGLYCPVEDCACEIDDFAPCGQFEEMDLRKKDSCRPGYKKPCNCKSQEHDFHISRKQ